MKRDKTDQRTLLTQRLLKQTYTALLRIKPIEEITVSEICALAGVNRGTFYTHYHDLYALRSQLEDEMFQEFQEVMLTLFHNSDKDTRPRAFSAAFLSYISEHPDLTINILGANAHRAFLHRLIDFGRSHCTETFSRLFPSIKPAYFSYFFEYTCAGCIGILTVWAAQNMVTPIDEMAELLEGAVYSTAEYFQNSARNFAE